MTETTQFCVGLDNKPGQLARLCGILRNAQVNVDALCISDDDDCVWVNLVLSPVETAERVLLENEYRFLTEKVLTLEVDNHPGELERITKKLAEAEVNISYVYGAGAKGAPCELILKVDDAARAREVLGNPQPREMMSG